MPNAASRRHAKGRTHDRLNNFGLLCARLALAALSGLFCYASFSPNDLWFLSILGIAALWMALCPWGGSRPRLITGALVGFVQALTMYLFLLPWIGQMVGNLPYVALAITEASYALLLGWAGAGLARRTSVLAAIGFSFLFIAVEWFRATWPFGGFSWGRLAWGQVSGPLLPIAALGGPALVSLSVCLVGVGLGWVAMRWRHSMSLAIASIVAVAALVLAGHAFPAGITGPQLGPAVTVAAVQGNVPRLGLDFNAQRRAVLKNHVTVTEKRVKKPVDLVIWPENSSDVNPFADKRAMFEIKQAVAAVKAPILVGTLTRDKEGEKNTMVVFDPVSGQGEWHNKKYLQPFGEWMPYRDLLRKVSKYVDMASNFKPGHGDGVVHMRAAQLGRRVAVGVTTCYEVAFDKAGRDAVAAGAQIMAVPTNNATFGYSKMTFQQLAMSRLRAVELHRPVVVAATSGVSAMVSDRGAVIEKTGIFEPAVLERSMRLHNDETFAVRFGTRLEAGMVMIGGIAFVCGALFAPRRKPRAGKRTRS